MQQIYKAKEATKSIGLFRSAFGRARNIIVQDLPFLITAASLHLNNTKHAMTLWADTKRNGITAPVVPLTERKDIRLIMRVKADWMLITPTIIYLLLVNFYSS
jgi:hypothetical protein